MGHATPSLGDLDQLTRLAKGDELPSETRALPALPVLSKPVAKRLLKEHRRRLRHLQEALWAERSRSLLVVLQGLDTAGKDGTLRATFRGVNPQGVAVQPFKVPSPEEAAHDYLWRVHAAVPAKGMIGVFNRSHYEDLLVPLASGSMDHDAFDKRVQEIHAFERYLIDQGTTIVKLYLSVSWRTQGKRLLERLERPEKHWKFSPSDSLTRAHFQQVEAAYRKVIPATSFEDCPWHVIPADRRWYRNTIAALVVTSVLASLDPKVPIVPVEHLQRYRHTLERELHEPDPSQAG
jgi:PPK2 family polyphosphate:nucleotide phosphotransferase